MCGVEVDGLDHGESVEMVCFSVHLYPGFGGAGDVAHADRVLYEPFVDGFGGMGHEYPALEVRLREDVRERSGMVDVETGLRLAPI